MARVRRAKSGEGVDFEEQGLTDEHVIAVAKALREPTVQVETLDFTKNEIGDAAAEALADALAENTTLKRLFLHFTHVGDYGAICLAGALPQNDTLSELGLAQTRVTDVGAEEIVSFVRCGLNKTLRRVAFNSINYGPSSKPVSQSLRDEIDNLCAQNV